MIEVSIVFGRIILSSVFFFCQQHNKENWSKSDDIGCVCVCVCVCE